MDKKNGIFQILIKNDGIYIKIITAEPGGQPVLYDEIANYLYDNKILEYDKLGLMTLVKGQGESDEVRISSMIIQPLEESLKVLISEDATIAKVRFYPPSDRGTLMTKDDIISKLSRFGIQYGVDENAIEQFLRERKYCTDYIVARGLPVTEGHDAQINYYFNINLSLQPKRNEDGSVDFHQLDLISHCKKGDLLAGLTIADPGKPGMDVCGRVIRPTKVKQCVLKPGKNSHLSEDGLQMYADVSGHASLVSDRVFVYDSYRIPANVDNSTGDIEYDGNVIVQGNVLTGFAVRAKGDIEVYGVVEGAYIEAGGQIVLRRGMQGVNKGILKANGNIIAKFIENAKVISGGYISTESIMHSEVTAQEDIVVGGRRGYVTGGRIRSGTSISVKNAGSSMGTMTILEVGVNPLLLDESAELEKNLSEMTKKKEKLSELLVMYQKKISMGVKLDESKREIVDQAAKGYVELGNQITQAKERYDAVRLEIVNHTSGEIVAYDTVYPGVKLIIAGIQYHIRNSVKYSKFVRDEADIKILPL